MQRFRTKIVAGTAAEFVAAKLAERDERHKRMGDSRYVVEPNVKDGKGGLRDLHTLYWIGKYVHGVEQPADLVRVGLFTAAEFRKFERAERFFWAVRCHLHLAAGRAEERLGFDHQRHIAEVMRYADRPGKSAVERFMQFYFLNAKNGRRPDRHLPRAARRAACARRASASPFRPSAAGPSACPASCSTAAACRSRATTISREDPVRLIELFALAAREQLEIHPTAMRAAARDAKLIDEKVRNDPRANALFLDVLTCVNSPELVLRWMNEAGVFGRFVPDFGRVVAQMQFDMYHHYTVDEHSIRAIGLLAAIERGELKDDHPLSTALFKQIGSRRTLYVAVLLHDIAKGRGGDHSELGAEIALKLGPRFGLDPAETETVVLAGPPPSADVGDRVQARPCRPQDDRGFRPQVQSPERLRLLLILTVVDIRAVGPGVWNEWKRALLRTLFDAAEERLRLGHKQRGRTELVEDAAGSSWPTRSAGKRARRGPMPGACPTATGWPSRPTGKLANARQVAAAEAQIGDAVPERRRPRTTPAAARPGSASSRPTARACSTASAPALRRPARTSSTRASTPRATAWRSTICWCRTGRAAPMPIARLRDRLVRAVEAALTATDPPPLPPRAAAAAAPAAFRVAPSVAIAERASNRTTVVEVNARDRPGLLAAAGRARSTIAGHRSIRRISRPMASARSTSSI